MTTTKYQVFISSTYNDLIDERKQILNYLLMADCIPAGMEAFVATDEEQFDVIKKVIDLCDYYILIIGKRYGSLNEKTGLSYTEMEYNYAIDKGIPVLVFAIDDSVKLSPDKTEVDTAKKKKLQEFKSKAMQNRLASIWATSADLMAKVAISIMRAQKEIKRPGWHRGDDINQELLEKELRTLRSENEILRSQVSTPLDKKANAIDLLESKIELHYTERVYFFTSTTVAKKKTINPTLKELFGFISLRMTGIKKANDFIEATSSFVSGYFVNTQDALILRNKFEQLGLFESYNGKDDIEMLKLTELGKEIMNQLN